MKKYESSYLTLGLVSLTVLGIVYQVLYQFFLKSHEEQYCAPRGLNEFITNCDAVSYFTFIFVIIAIFLLIQHFTNRQLWDSWGRFTSIYLFIYLLIYLFTPDEARDFIPYAKVSVALVSLILYPILSIIVILIAKKKQKSS